MAVRCDGAATGASYRLGAVSSSPRDAPFIVAMLMNSTGVASSWAEISMDRRSYGPRIESIPKFAAELVKAKVDVIVVDGTAAIRAAQGATITIPIVGTTDDMVGAGLVNSLARPGGNTTG